MPAGLHRTYGAHHLHFITVSCYHRLPFLNAPESRDTILDILEQTRQRYRFVVVGYVVMPEHVHLLITEPAIGNPSTVLQVLKQRTAKALLHTLSVQPSHFWQERFYDFNVWTTKKRAEKLRYIHRNPVKRGLVDSPEQWRWSSYRHYLLEEPGPVQINVGWGEINVQESDRLESVGGQNLPTSAAPCPPFAIKPRRTGHPLFRWGQQKSEKVFG